ncbi:hypothetical protein [Burkholderia sp. PAMC 26561]|uniref:hypothetical protein n=1 Tax=Burkholderia sp. PAMC 26561 TaxID=1795043 RepID=UPI0007855083|nr:hypothetical protein [Burkholderia sp. PAMC 26561]
MNATPTSRVSAQLVKADGTTINVPSVEYFSVRRMIWLRELRFDPNSIVEVVIGDRHHLVKTIKNKEQVCEIMLESE